MFIFTCLWYIQVRVLKRILIKKDVIPRITQELYKNIKQSYTGGSVDVYKPVGTKINRYDINSLYPAVMSQYESPVGKIQKFKGDILKLMLLWI